MPLPLSGPGLSLPGGLGQGSDCSAVHLVLLQGECGSPGNPETSRVLRRLVCVQLPAAPLCTSASVCSFTKWAYNCTTAEGFHAAQMNPWIHAGRVLEQFVARVHFHSCRYYYCTCRHWLSRWVKGGGGAPQLAGCSERSRASEATALHPLRSHLRSGFLQW